MTLQEVVGAFNVYCFNGAIRGPVPIENGPTLND